jgi:hypothetical protein
VIIAADGPNGYPVRKDMDPAPVTRAEAPPEITAGHHNENGKERSDNTVDPAVNA